MRTGDNMSRPLGRVGRVVLVALIVAGVVLASVDPVTFLLFGAYMAVGSVLAFLRPGNVVGWLVIAIAFGFITTSTPPDASIAAQVRGEATIPESLVIWLGGWSGLATYIAFLALTIVFPDGHLPHAGRRTSVALLVAGVMVVIVAAVAPTFDITLADGITNVVVANPFPFLPTLSVWSRFPAGTVVLPLAIALLAIGVIRMVIRYRRAFGVERLQLRWLVASVALMFTSLVFGLGVIVVLDESAFGLGWIPALIAYPTIPVAIGVAVLRYRLLEIDRIISRTIGYGLVTGLLLAAYASAILILQGTLGTLTGSDTILVALSTLLVAALFQPLRRRVQRAVDRRFDRARYDGEQTAVAFSARLRDEVDLPTVTADLSTTARSALAPATLAIWIRRPGSVSR